jgi:hypothetical protein
LKKFAILPLAKLTHSVNERNLPKLKWRGNLPKIKWEKSPITALLEKYPIRAYWENNIMG